MSVWASSPSPSVDVLSSQPSLSSSDFLVGWHVPHRLWDAYLAYLWYYQPNSWVGRLASTFRILAVILILPVVLLTLLDVTSYVIARTLGIVDDVKASTNDTDARDAQDKIGVAGPVVARVATCACSSSSFSPISSSLSDRAGISVGGPVRVIEEDSAETRTVRDADADEDGHCCVPKTAMASAAAAQSITIQSQTHTSDMPPQAYYFTGEEDSLRLAGEGVFSPAVSMPPSPLTPRMPLHTFAESDGREIGQASEGSVLRRRVQSEPEDELGHT